MSIDVPAIRPRVLADDTFPCMDELMRFRHFRRYYFDRRYDRERREFLGFLDELARAVPRVPA